MFPRRPCPRCSRSISVNRDGEIRSHFCPHYTTCERDICAECRAQRAENARLRYEPDEHPHEN